MIGVITISFAVANIVLAFIDSRKLLKGNVSHFVNAIVYCALVAIPVFILHNYWLIGALLFTRLLVFNITLSLLRGKKWDYISPSPKAVTDKLAKYVFGYNGRLMYMVYASVMVLFILVCYLKK